MESPSATLKKEIRHIHGPWEHLHHTRLRTILFDYIEMFHNRQRHHSPLGHRTPTQTHTHHQTA